MTTSNSPVAKLRKQAEAVAKTMKLAEAGQIPDPMARKARATRPVFKAGIVMDDKLITIEMPWDKIRDTSEAGLAEFVLKQMRGHTDAQH